MDILSLLFCIAVGKPMAADGYKRKLEKTNLR